MVSMRKMGSMIDQFIDKRPRLDRFLDKHIVGVLVASSLTVSVPLCYYITPDPTPVETVNRELLYNAATSAIRGDFAAARSFVSQINNACASSISWRIINGPSTPAQKLQCWTQKNSM